MTHKERIDLMGESVRIIVTLAVFALGAYCICDSDQTLQKVGVGFVGMVAGYWLR